MSEKKKDKVEEQRVARTERYLNRTTRRDNPVLLAINPVYNSTPSPINSEINVSIVNLRVSNQEVENKFITNLPNEGGGTNNLTSWNLTLKRKVTLPHVPRKPESLKYQPEISISTPPRVKEESFDKGLTPPYQGKFDSHFRAPFSNPFFGTPLSPLSAIFSRTNRSTPEAITPPTIFEIGSFSSQTKFRTPLPASFDQKRDPKNERGSSDIPSFTVEEITTSLDQFIKEVKVEANKSPILSEEKRKF